MWSSYLSVLASRPMVLFGLKWPLGCCGHHTIGGTQGVVSPQYIFVLPMTCPLKLPLAPDVLAGASAYIQHNILYCICLFSIQLVGPRVGVRGGGGSQEAEVHLARRGADGDEVDELLGRHTTRLESWRHADSSLWLNMPNYGGEFGRCEFITGV